MATSEPFIISVLVYPTATTVFDLVEAAFMDAASAFEGHRIDSGEWMTSGGQLLEAERTSDIRRAETPMPEARQRWGAEFRVGVRRTT